MENNPTETKPFHLLSPEYGTIQPASDILTSQNNDQLALTPLQLGRYELYKHTPFVALLGVDVKSKSVSRTFVSCFVDATQQQQSQAGYLLEELEDVLITGPFVLAILVGGLGHFLMGYNTSVLNCSLAIDNSIQYGVIMASFAFGGVLGVSSVSIMQHYGRRTNLLISSWMVLLGGLIQVLFAWDMILVTFGRFVIGYACGLSSVITPIYLGELTPPTLRGTIGTILQLCFVSGILAANLLASLFANEESRKIHFVTVAIVAVFQILCFPLLMESPVWLLGKDLKSDQARRDIKRLRGFRYDHEVNIEIHHIVHASQVQSCPSDGMFRDKHLRRLMVCLLFLQMAQQLSGINVMFYYSSMLFDGYIDDPILGTFIVGASNLIATYAGLVLAENYNRKTLLVFSVGGMLVSLLALGLCFLGYFHKLMVVWFSVGYVSSFGIGLGPIPWLIMSDCFEAKYVASTMTVSHQVNWVCNFLIAISFPYIQRKLGSSSFIPFATVLLITMGFIIVWLPETKGTTPEEQHANITQSFSSLFDLSDDNTSGDYTSSVGNIDLEWRRAMDDLRRQEEDMMMKGTYNYGFQPIEQEVKGEQYPEMTTKLSDWKSSITGGLDI